jgi:hypothetical protein
MMVSPAEGRRSRGCQPPVSFIVVPEFIIKVFTYKCQVDFRYFLKKSLKQSLSSFFRHIYMDLLQINNQNCQDYLLVNPPGLPGAVFTLPGPGRPGQSLSLRGVNHASWASDKGAGQDHPHKKVIKVS